MASVASANTGQGRRLEGENEENPTKKAVLGVLPPAPSTQSACEKILEQGLKEADQVSYAAQNAPSLLPADGASIPLPQDEEEEEDKSMAGTEEKDAPFYTEPIMKNYMEKYFNQTVFAQFKKETADVTTAIANHMKFDISTKEKFEVFMDHKPTNAEVITLIHAHFNTLTVPMVKLISKNIDDLFRPSRRRPQRFTIALIG